MRDGYNYLVDNFFPKPSVVERSNEVIDEYIAKNLSLLGDGVEPCDLPTDTNGGIRNWIKDASLPIERNPGKGFYLCLRSALIVSLAEYHKTSTQFGVLGPFDEFEVSAWHSFHDIPSDNLAGRTIKQLESEGLAKQHKLTGFNMAKKVMEDVFSADGVLLIRHSLYFPQFENSDISHEAPPKFGHWIVLMRGNMVGGMLHPYGLEAFRAKVADVNGVLEGIDKPDESDVESRLSHDSDQANAISFFPSKSERIRI